MKLLIAFAFIALVSAAPEAQPIEDPAPSPVKVVDGPTPILIKDDSPLSTADAADEISPVKVIDAPVDSEVAEEVSPVKVVDEVSPVKDAPINDAVVVITPVIVVDSEVAEKINPVKVAYSSAESNVADDVAQAFQFPDISPEILYQQYEDVRNLIDISPDFVSTIVIQEASMADPLENVDRVNVVDGPEKVVDSPVADEVSPEKDAPIDDAQKIPVIFPEILYQDVRNLIDISPAFVSTDVNQDASMADPLENVDRVNVVDGPVDVLNKMEPEAPIEDSQVPVQVLPREAWRGPAPLEEEQVLAQRPSHWRNLPPMHLRPAFVSTDVNQEASMADPLENVDRVNVVDGPVDILNKMEPEAPIEDSQVPVQVLPREAWRGPTPLEEEQVLAQRPSHWRDLPPIHLRPQYYRDNILR